MTTSARDTGLDSHELARLHELARHSHAVITRHQDAGGAYPAAPTFSAYRGYAWLRDGSFTAEGISRYGDVASAGRFHDWVDGVLRRRRGQVDDLLAAVDRGEVPSNEGMLPTRFTFDGNDGSDPWWDFQTDGYGMWLWSVVTHAARHGLDLERWRAGIDVAVDYLLAFWDRPCYDWWEEHVEHRHVSTLGAIHGGLVAVGTCAALRSAPWSAATLQVAARIRSLVSAEGVVDGHLVKWLGSSAVDGSLPACVVPFGLVPPDDDVAAMTRAAVAKDLDVDGGVHRFAADVFYGGGQWILLSALLGWNLAAAGDTAGALRHLRWIADQADADGDLPEQVPHHLLHPGSRAEWVARWGTVATPLLWSHGMYLILADELGLLPPAAKDA
ncbi:glycoside hydrolase 15-related protein [Kribbella flavida DSM 17836]|uniref:Isomaltose glucohydrolase n=2 Tax=Kribbella flavida (strain DSM 17836 / JCM 10339 / NBRC 14399) TaxID=479435 RepID=IMGH_KRIFD|nr:glycoside hydrolase family 15 protein [Kribbella flavida]D2PPM8.1 RecName: Full=Isomaltose glucohydrolase [Kribbella flavida DSM 17836]ADB30990.1 glycoside hydrolase 15-related protein [Kribbella flavida DSM 17836]